MRFQEQPVVGIASSPELYEAVSAAVDKLEKQVVKLHEKRRERKRVAQPSVGREASANAKNVSRPAAPRGVAGNGIAVVVAEASGRSSQSAKVFRVADHKLMKPMTLDEAMLEIGRNQEYFCFPDADTGGVSVLIRRADGHFDLVEGG
jgi:hypothetical protein